MDEKPVVPTVVNDKSTRREILGTGAKLAYAAPLVAATFKLSASGALATGDHGDKNCCPEWDHHEAEGGDHEDPKWLYAVCHENKFYCVILKKSEAEAHKAHGDTVVKWEYPRVCLPECGDIILSPRK